MHKVVGQAGFADAFVAGSRRGAHRLEQIAALLDWPKIAALLQPLHGKTTGRPGYPPELLYRALLLAQWYSLSDPQLEEALADRGVVSPLCRAVAQRRGARRDHAVPLPRRFASCAAGRAAARGDQPPARCARHDHPRRHTDRRERRAGGGAHAGRAAAGFGP